MDRVRDLDDRLNAAADPAEMRRLITERRMLRTELSLAHAVEQHRREHPAPAPERFRLFGTLGRRR